MTEFIWTVPTRVPHRPAFDPSVRDDRPGRFTAFDEDSQVARAAELAGFDGVVVPYDPGGEESWVVAAALAPEVPRLGIVAEFPPDLGTAVYAAKLALSFQRFFSDRLSWQIVLDGDADPSLADSVSGPARDTRTEEFLTVTRGVFGDAPYTFHGEFYEVEAGGFFDPSGTVPGLSQLVRARSPHPRVLLGSQRQEGLSLSARFGDVHVFDEPRPELLRAAIADVQARAAHAGRIVGAALRIAVVARDSDAEARRDLSRATGHPEDGPVWSLPAGAPALTFDFSPSGWRARSAIVGSYEAVADQLRAYVELGIGTFVLEGLHPVADAYRFGEYVRPLLSDTFVSA